MEKKPQTSSHCPADAAEAARSGCSSSAASACVCRSRKGQDWIKQVYKVDADANLCVWSICPRSCRASADAQRPARRRSRKGLADPGAAGRGRRPAGPARDVPGEAVAQRRRRGPHAHRPRVDPAQGARGRSGRGAISRRSPGPAIAWRCRCASCPRPIRRSQPPAGRRWPRPGRLRCGPSRRTTWPKPTPISGSALPTP